MRQPWLTTSDAQMPRGAGKTAPAGTVNAGNSLAPYRTKEYEVGYKLDFNRISYTVALFDMDRPFANTNTATNTYEVMGDQVNKGLELTAIGSVLDGLTVYSGLTLMQSKMEHTPMATTNGREYVGTPKVKGNVLVEYHIPQLTGLVATFDYQFAGTREADDTNQFSVAGYSLFDVGARYTLKMWDMPVAWRLAVDNITDRHYWSTIGPSNLTGANTGNLVAHLGTPRTVNASVSVKF